MTIQSPWLKGAIGLALFALVTGGVVSITHALTWSDIQDNRAYAASQALRSLAPEPDYQLDLKQEVIRLGPVPALGQTAEFKIYRARTTHDELGLLLLPVISHQGYSGDIKLLVAVDIKGQVQGIRVLMHQETPGLGDRIEQRKSNWLEQFTGQSLQQLPDSQWRVKKDGGHFDQLTGATITPRAVVGAVYQALHWVQEHHDTLWMDDIQAVRRSL
ncbi:hypothetical protein BFW38_07120 [Terasakiispira papahanaumokuakeensis]|uniref:Ion-translocating oxidoreductase complex subunit G n=1 Tax=Terasakiispira papahanaumokuakeensis TaxID=197479 RepID=A0A1E2V920_9GAMM|nr:electron transport complex subunit RsxG [Terasakiispira papahanaumokuakeensis]ODC03352.1 hypothetical protein BFW38_07120 [Terasakiispira papahanaumokuakeensis]